MVPYPEEEKLAKLGQPEKIAPYLETEKPAELGQLEKNAS